MSSAGQLLLDLDLFNSSLYPDRNTRNSGQKPTKLGKCKNNYDNITKRNGFTLLK